VSHYAIDAPTLLHLVTHDLAVDPQHQLVAPNSIRSQALSLMLAAVGNGELTDRQAMALHDGMTAVKIRLLGDRSSRHTAWKIAREHGWDNIVDAEYLAIARLQADALVTVDPALAARAHGVVPVADLEVLLP
jgi:predicted nucleic acid-binding protein